MQEIRNAPNYLDSLTLSIKVDDYWFLLEEEPETFSEDLRLAVDFIQQLELMIKQYSSIEGLRVVVGGQGTSYRSFLLEVPLDPDELHVISMFGMDWNKRTICTSWNLNTPRSSQGRKSLIQALLLFQHAEERLARLWNKVEQ